ncbi:MobF family relaxase [Corynebacterium doosanense]|uniref:TraA protein n=1 Tax=Corynebacterium doosanense CAU 212 = DSM 45436 TaxID=558173 RepID=A0A097IJT4_9CORY|nr:MobF family relaxase [Corynebacterium doosanense]AIT62370.1 TraA protein [Corynebacterium doosanense CAU 212 = DSM 45436]
MMSFRAVHAGSGYQYLLRSVATNDAYDPTVETGKLSGYYQAKGTPPGRWIGSGLTALVTTQRGQEVEADQMEALYGVGLHPDAHTMIEGGASFEDCRLGGKFPVFTNSIPVLDALRAAEKSAVAETGRLLTDAERSQLAASVGASFYRAAEGVDYAPDKDVIDWVNQQQAQVKQAVAGFDLTFSPAKSISVLWALSDEDTASRIAACHHEAVAEVLSWAETNVVRTRMGAGGLAQVETNGIVASEFTHFDTRAGDPDLHSHVLVANKVQGPDGKWRTLDSRAMFKNHQTLSARYDMVVQEILTRKMGLAFEASAREQGKEPVWEVAGVPQKLIDAFSTRRTLARPVFEKLREEFVASHGHQPDKRAQLRLWQAAILDTREAKKPAESLATLRADWRADVEHLDGGDELLARVQSLTSGAELDERPAFFADDVSTSQRLDDVSLAVIDRVIQKRSYFARHHVTAGVGAYLKGFRFSDADEAARVFDAVCENIITHHLVDLTAEEPLAVPRALRRANGETLDRGMDFAQFTTARLLAQEDYVLRAVTEPVAVFARDKTIAQALVAAKESSGFALNTGQEALARQLLQAGTVISSGVGPAGTGKTTAMTLVADVWKAEQRQVIGLAPSAAAATVLSDEVGIDAHTIDSLAFVWRGRNPNKPAGDPAALPVDLRPGDMLLVDEAGMATTDNLAALAEIAQATGAVVRLIGDPQQLDAVGSGGLFATMCRYGDATELTDVMRFSHGNDTEQAEASLRLRRGEVEAVDFYNRRGWVRGGTRNDMLSAAVDAYLADVERGKRSLIVASTNADVALINEAIRSYRVERGLVEDTDTVALSRGEVAGVGDLIIARKNERLVAEDGTPGRKVTNGQLLHVRGVHATGGLDVEDEASGQRFVLPADYVRSSTHLGYGSTVHRAQGATVETTHAVIDAQTSRTGLYVALTRGKQENRVYAVTDDALDEFAEAAHEHMAGNIGGLSAEAVMRAAIARDQRQLSARDMAEKAREYAGSDDRVSKLYAYGVDKAYQRFIDHNLDGWWDMLDPDAAQALTDEGRQKVRSAWVESLRAGIDPRDLMNSATFNLGEVEEPGAVIAWRLREQVSAVATPGRGLAAVPPLTRTSDRELHQWLVRTRERFESAAAEPAPRQSAAQQQSGDALRDMVTADLGSALQRQRAQQRTTPADSRKPTAASTQERVRPGNENDL